MSICRSTFATELLIRKRLNPGCFCVLFCSLVNLLSGLGSDDGILSPPPVVSSCSLLSPGWLVCKVFVTVICVSNARICAWLWLLEERPVTGFQS